MEAFNIFKTGAQNDDSDCENDTESKQTSIFGTHKTPARDKRYLSRDLNLSYSHKAKNTGSVKRQQQPTNQPAAQLKRVRMAHLRPVNTLDQHINQKRMEKAALTVSSSSGEKAGNENQENNDANWVDDTIEDDTKYQKQIQENKTICQDLKSTMEAAMQRMQSAQRKITQKRNVQTTKSELPLLSKVEEMPNSEEKSLVSEAHSGIKKTRKTLDFEASQSSGSRLMNLSETPNSAETKNTTAHEVANVRKFESCKEEEDEDEGYNQPKTTTNPAKKRAVSTKRKATGNVSQNFVRNDLRGGYRQKDRRIRTRCSKYLNKRKKIMDEKYRDMKVKSLGAHGGFGSEGLDGAFVSELSMQHKVIPIFSPKFTEDYVKPEKLEVPQDDQGYLNILKEKFGFENFFEGQLESIKAILEKEESCMCILSTGGGKSLIYQYCSLFMEGLCIVITPLISLMTDQLQKLPACISGACLNSYQNSIHKKQVSEALSNNQISVLFLSPERLVVEDFEKHKQKISLVCIDEIHCSSEWSHNFRPSYLKLEDVICNRLNCNRILGLTATATKDTEMSLVREYGFKNVVRNNDLSRMNLSLCITRDEEGMKMSNLCKLIRSPEYKNCKSIIIYCTYKSTTDNVARYLTQNGIESKSYHAGKSDVDRQYIQDCFNKNLVRCIVCTIAFSMGIDKKDVNSVIHYDMPQSIESYVQEIGRAGRDGKLAKCHLIISDRNYYALRQLLLTNMIDREVALKFVSRLMKEIKQVVVDKQINSYMGKRKIVDIEDDSTEFKVNEETNEIIFDKPKYVFIPVETICDDLDIKKEVALTLFSYLENHYLSQDGDYFIRLFSNTPIIMNLRFYTTTAEELAEENLFMKNFLEVCSVRDGVYKASIPVLCSKMDIPPFEIPRILNELQTKEKLTYELEKESFCLHAYKLKSDIPEIARTLLARANEIEENSIRKLNSIYIAARRLSFKSIDYLLRVSGEQTKAKEGKANRTSNSFLDINLELAPEMNNLINTYFLTDDFKNIENVLAGDMGVEEYLPLVKIDNARELAEIERDVKALLDGCANNEYSSSFSADNAPQLGGFTCLDIVKILLGINSKNISITFFRDNPLWSKYSEHDYHDVIKYVRETYISYQVESAQKKMNEEGTSYLSKRQKPI